MDMREVATITLNALVEGGNAQDLQNKHTGITRVVLAALWDPGIGTDSVVREEMVQALPL